MCSVCPITFSGQIIIHIPAVLLQAVHEPQVATLVARAAVLLPCLHLAVHHAPADAVLDLQAISREVASCMQQVFL